jgi:hypothetical protein
MVAVVVVPFALLVAAGLLQAARESEPRPSVAGHPAGNHLQVALKQKPAEPAHRPQPLLGTRNFSGIGY